MGHQVFATRSSIQLVGILVFGKRLAVHQSCLPSDVLFDQTTKFSCVDELEVFNVFGYGKYTQLGAL